MDQFDIKNHESVIRRLISNFSKMQCIEMQHWFEIGRANLSELIRFYTPEIIRELIDGFLMISGELK